MVTNNGFVDIVRVYNEQFRDIDHLSQLYDDIPKMVRLIKGLIKARLKDEDIKNKKILLKPNWVKHPENKTDLLCLTTHESFIIATAITIAALDPQKITIGDAPIQGCKWDQMISKSFYEQIDKVRLEYKVDIEIIDFRRVKFDPKSNLIQSNVTSLEDFVIMDVGERSYLEPITEQGRNKFRVTHYDPDKFRYTHTKGMHKYCITKHLFNSDLVISLPKAKTHQKAGITAALKNIVGLNGDKDYLPHHRIGGTEVGGDAYPGKSYLRYLAERAYDRAYKSQGSMFYKPWMRMASLIWKLSFPNSEDIPGAAWYGNDTVWRMVMDLNLVINYGKNDGTLSETPQRSFYSLCDGIIGGQGDGPLHPDPLALGIISFTNYSSWHDIVISTLMRLDPTKISLLRAARLFMPERKVEIMLDGKKVSISDLVKYSILTTPPPGWVKHFTKK
jgi:uncharacterized protein (DUF362 family)